MTKAELRAQGIQALAQVTTPIMKLPMKIRRQCGRCGDFNSVLAEPGKQCRCSNVRPAVTQQGEARDFGLKTPARIKTFGACASSRSSSGVLSRALLGPCCNSLHEAARLVL